MSLLIQLSQAARRVAYADPLVRATKNPLKCQSGKLLSIIRKNRDTFFGRKHSFSSIRTIEDFQRLVPIQNYESLRPYIEEMKDGKRNILTAQQPIMFAVTSGTTGRSKFIPVTEDFVKEYRASWQAWIYFAQKEHPGMFEEKVVTFVSPAVQAKLPSGIPYGSISGLLQEIQPEIVRKHYSLFPEIFRIKDYDARYYAISRIILEDNVSLMISPNPGLILLISKKMNECQREIIDDIEAGTLSYSFDIEPEIRGHIEKSLRPNPERAADLMAMRRINNGLFPKDVWRNLVLVGCWKEGNMPLYLRQFPKYFGAVKTRDIGLMATEGRISVPIDDKGGAGLISLATHFFEFIPEEERELASPRTLTADRLEAGKSYYVLLTASNGLYRYDLNDVVKVTGFYNRCPVIDFMHKGEHVTSIAGEKLSEWQVVTAVRHAAEKLDAPVESFTASIHWGKPPCYVFFVEFHEKVAHDMKLSLIKEIDLNLKKLNIEYRNKRESMRLAHPILRHVLAGSYQNRHRHLVANGAHDAQVKHPCLVDDIRFEKHFREHLKIAEEVRINENIRNKGI